LKTVLVGMLLTAMLLTTTISLGVNGILLSATTQSQTEELNTQFEEIMTDTLNFLDRAWDVAKKFQDPNYNYDPSDLGNYTVPEIPQFTGEEG